MWERFVQQAPHFSYLALNGISPIRVEPMYFVHPLNCYLRLPQVSDACICIAAQIFAIRQITKSKWCGQKILLVKPQSDS